MAQGPFITVMDHIKLHPVMEHSLCVYVHAQPRIYCHLPLRHGGHIPRGENHFFSKAQGDSVKFRRPSSFLLELASVSQSMGVVRPWTLSGPHVSPIRPILQNHIQSIP